jgi:hypothetical protein
MGYTKLTAALGVAMMAGFAGAGTVDLNYTGVAGGTSAAHLRVAGVTYYAGHMTHVYTSGARSGQTFNTFCIDVNEAATPGSATYQIIRLEDAPLPGSPYGVVKAAAVSDVVANAISLGWIGADLQANPLQAGYLGKMGAIQAAIWAALGFDVQVSASQTSSSLKTYYAQLMTAMTNNSQMSTDGLRAIAASGQQDMLYIVPLPPAAFAGAGLLAIGFGVRAVRRRSN